MKNKVLLLVSVAAIIISSCTKDEIAYPDVKVESIKLSEKGLMCNCGGGTWDLSEDPSTTPQAATFRIVTTDTIPVVKKSEEKNSRKDKSDRKKDDSKENKSDRKEK
jgi:hypothetical protein